MINGENKLDDADKDDPYYLGKYEFFERTDIPEEDGSYTAFYQLQFTNGITFDHLNFTIGLTDITDLIEKQNGFVKSEQTELLGTIDVTVSLDTSVQEVTLNYTEPIAIPNKNGTGYLKHLEIQALSMQLSGTGDMQLFDSYDSAYPVTITYADGSTMTPDCKNSSISFTDQSDTPWEYNIDFDEPIAPEGIVSIEFGGTTIPFH